MLKRHVKQFFDKMDVIRGMRLLGEQKRAFIVLSRFRWSRADDGASEFNGKKDAADRLGKITKNLDSEVSGYGSEGDESSSYNYNIWKPDITWMSKALEPALALYKWALPAGNRVEKEPAPTDRSLSEIFASIRRSKLGIQDWSLSDLTIGLYLLYLHQASTKPVEDVTGELISSESIIHDLIYHIELAKGAYKSNTAGIARNCMLRENNIVKFVRKSNVLRPGYYLGLDMQKKLVILCIRGTQNVYDLITNIISSGHEEVTFEGYSAHFGTAEAARWFLTHEIDSIRMCLNNHKDFRLRIVGHSMGGATASLLAIMLRKKSFRELGFNPDMITAVGVATPPCVSKELAESCTDFVTTVVMQDDIIPRLSIASLKRLRKEIVETDWVNAFKREDWKGVINLVTNAKHIVSSVHDVAQKLAEYAQFRELTKRAEMPTKEGIPPPPSVIATSCPPSTIPGKLNQEIPAGKAAEHLFVPGMLYYLKRNTASAADCNNPQEYFTLLRRNPGEHSQRILLSSNIISDHRCDSHYCALRDVLKVQFSVGATLLGHETGIQWLPEEILAVAELI